MEESKGDVSESTERKGYFMKWEKGIGTRFTAALLAAALATVMALASCTGTSHAASYTVKQWGQGKLNDQYLSRYDGHRYDYCIKGMPYNHCTGYVSWALRNVYGIPSSAFAMNKPYVRNIRDWVLKNRKAQNFRLVGGGTVNVKTGKVRHTRGYDPKPGDIVFFHTKRNSLTPATTLKTGFAGMGGYWSHVAIIGSTGKLHHDKSDPDGYCYKYTPDSLIRRNVKFIRYSGYSYSYQVWRLAPSVDPSLTGEAEVEGTGARIASVDSEILLRDTMQMKNLTEGARYVLTGIVMNAATGEPYRDAEGNTVTVKKTFTAESGNCRLELEYPVNTSGMEDGSKLYLFSELRLQGEQRVLASSGGADSETETVLMTKK